MLIALAATLISAFEKIIESRMVNSKFTKIVSPLESLVSSAYVNALIILAIIFVTPGSVHFQATWITVITLGTIGILDFWYNLFMLKALQGKSATETSAILSMSPILVLGLSTFLPGMSQTWISLLPTVVLIVLGVYLLQTEKGQKPFAHLNTPSSLYAIAATVCIAISSMIVSHTLDAQLSSELFLLFVRMSIIAVFGHLVFRPRFFPSNFQKRTWLLIILCTEALYVFEWILKVKAIGQESALLATAIFSTTPLFVLGMDALFLKQKLTRRKSMGAGLIVTGLLLTLSIKSVD